MVVAVVQGDQRELAGHARHLEVADQGPGDDLVVESRRGRRLGGSARCGHCWAPSVSSVAAGLAGVVRVLPDHRGALAEPDAHRGQPVAHLGVLGELPGQLDHQPDAGGGQRVAERDRPAVLVDPGVVVVDAVVVEEGQHLHGEGLVQLEQADVVDGQAGAGQRPLGGRDRADAHHLGVDAGEAVADQGHPHRQAELGGGVGAGQDAGGRPVVEAGGVAGGDPAVRAERGLQRRPGRPGWCSAGAARPCWPAPSPARRTGSRPAPGRAGSCPRRRPWRPSPGCAARSGRRAPWSGAGTGRAGSPRSRPSTARPGRPACRPGTAGWGRRPRPSGGGPCAPRRRRWPRRRRRRRWSRRRW